MVSNELSPWLLLTNSIMTKHNNGNNYCYNNFNTCMSFINPLSAGQYYYFHNRKEYKQVTVLVLSG